MQKNIDLLKDKPKKKRFRKKRKKMATLTAVSNITLSSDSE